MFNKALIRLSYNPNFKEGGLIGVEGSLHFVGTNKTFVR
jgi:hypothetical protein